MSKTTALERQNKILEVLECTPKLRVEEAMELLGVSRSTVFRIFADMEEKGVILRVQGGASLVRDNLEYTYERLENVMLEEKKRIGQCAALMVSNGDSLFLDTGTTLPHLCLALTKRIENGELKEVRIFTSSLSNLMVLQKVTDVYLLGGKYRHTHRDFQGYITEEAIKPLHFTKCFLGADGVDHINGFTTVDFSSARLNRIVCSNSSQCYVLADSSKFGKISSIKYADIADVHGLITDFNGKDKAESLIQAGVPIHWA